MHTIRENFTCTDLSISWGERITDSAQVLGRYYRESSAIKMKSRDKKSKISIHRNLKVIRQKEKFLPAQGF